MSMEPPPPPASADSAVTRRGDRSRLDQHRRRGAYGWNAYWKNVGPMVVIAIVVIAINVVVGLIAQATDSIAFQIIIQFIGFLVSMLLALGWIRVSLDVTRGTKPEVGDLFKFDGYGPYIGRRSCSRSASTSGSSSASSPASSSPWPSVSTDS